MANRKRELAIVTEIERFEVWAKDSILEQIVSIEGVAEFVYVVSSYRLMLLLLSTQDMIGGMF